MFEDKFDYAKTGGKGSSNSVWDDCAADAYNPNSVARADADSSLSPTPIPIQRLPEMPALNILVSDGNFHFKIDNVPDKKPRGLIRMPGSFGSNQ